MILKSIFLALAISFIGLPDTHSQISRKSKVEFYGFDSLLISADHYYSRKSNPYIILFHTEQSSRGEFESLAERFIKMQYNCLAVDLRSGDINGFVKSETSERAKEIGLPINLLSGERDMLAAIEYAYDLSKEPLVLLGSSSSATLALKIAANNSNIKAVLAFSPGEFFAPEFELETIFQNIEIPVFLTGNSNEKSLLEGISSQSEVENITLFSPPENSLGRGTSLLLEINPVRDEYWMAVLIFIKSIKDIANGEVSDNPL